MTPQVELEDLVTQADIARRVGTSRQRVNQLADRDDFPAAVGRVGNYRVWRWTDVQQWYAEKRG